MEHEIYIKTNQLPLVKNLGCVNVEQWYRHPDRTNSFHSFLYILKGNVQVSEADKEYLLSEDSYVFFKAGIRHWGKLKIPPGTKWNWIQFYSNSENNTLITSKDDFSLLQTAPQYRFSKEIYESFLLLPKTGIASNPMSIRNALQKINHIYLSNLPLKHLQISIETYKLFLEIYVQHRSNTMVGKADVAVKKIMSFILENYYKELTSKDIGNYLGMNYTYLSNIFKRKTGKSIIKYLNEIRIEKATILLSQTNFTISEISSRVGFKNPFYFSTVFKKHIGLSPSEYLKQIY